jgi:hypothetical protein
LEVLQAVANGMASAYFLNATPYVIAVNLNAALQNQIVTPSISLAEESVTLAAWKAPIASSPRPGEFGGNKWQNLLLVISEASLSYPIWEISSSVQGVLDLYLYIFFDQIVGMDATGSTAGIVVRPASQEVAARVFIRTPPAAL